MYFRVTKNHINAIKAANPYLILSTVTAFVIGLYYALIQSPPDYIQGDSMRIMYIHVPSAWFALMCYTILAGSSVLWFITRNPTFNLVARSIAQIGMMFTVLSLVTGSIWGKPTWGVWWVWDARLTSMLLLFFLYLAYIFLWQAIANKDIASKISAALAIIGFSVMAVSGYVFVFNTRALLKAENVKEWNVKQVIGILRNQDSSRQK